MNIFYESRNDYITRDDAVLVEVLYEWICIVQWSERSLRYCNSYLLIIKKYAFYSIL